jgi:hypothetical protein
MSAVGDRLFSAWWPGSFDAASAQLTTPSGTAAQAINTAPLPPWPSFPPYSYTSAPTTSSVSCSHTAASVTDLSNDCSARARSARARERRPDH